jgi:SAM-dependent methyltransferase
MTDSNVWNNLHDFYSKQNWINKPNIFAEEILRYLPKKGSILCLGDGQGQDGRFFAYHGYDVTSTDISDSALNINRTKTKEEKLKNIKIGKLDLKEIFPYNDNSFDVVYAHLSIHYFNEKTTKQIFSEIKRVLRPEGIAAIFTNSTDDPEYNSGRKIEKDLFEIEGVQKRFFSVDTMKEFTKDFEKILLDNKGKTYKDEAKGVHNLIRFIGKKV